MEYKVVRKNKTYKKRILKIYEGKKLVNEVMPWMGWYCWCKPFRDDGTHIICRRKVLENLYWLLGRDCDKSEWIRAVEQWDQGKHIYGVPIDKLQSVFHNDDERLTAIESFDI